RLFLLSWCHPDLPSFPTRRSSDLRGRPVSGYYVASASGIVRSRRALVAGCPMQARSGSIASQSFTCIPATTVSARTHSAEIAPRSEEHTSELQSRFDLVCRLLLES